jgi:hypothetical protein
LFIVLNISFVQLNFQLQIAALLRGYLDPRDHVHKTAVHCNGAVQLGLQIRQMVFNVLVLGLSSLQQTPDMHNVHRFVPIVVHGAILPAQYCQVLLSHPHGVVLLVFVGSDHLLSDVNLLFADLCKLSAQLVPSRSVRERVRRRRSAKDIAGGQLRPEICHLLLQPVDHAFVFRDVVIYAGDVARGLESDVLRSVGIAQGVVGVLVAQAAGTDVGDHDSPAVPLEGVLEHACQFGVTIWHMGSALRIL